MGEITLIGVNLQDDPYLMRYASLVYSVNSDNYVQDGVGILWLLRDIIRDKSVPGTLGLYCKPFVDKHSFGGLGYECQGLNR